jgi:hypothetical protein
VWQKLPAVETSNAIQKPAESTAQQPIAQPPQRKWQSRFDIAALSETERARLKVGMSPDGYTQLSGTDLVKVLKDLADYEAQQRQPTA